MDMHRVVERGGFRFARNDEPTIADYKYYHHYDDTCRTERPRDALFRDADHAYPCAACVFAERIPLMRNDELIRVVTAMFYHVPFVDRAHVLALIPNEERESQDRRLTDRGLDRDVPASIAQQASREQRAPQRD